MSSVNTAGSRELDPYTALVDFTMSFCTFGDFWHAASSCMVPMTFISFIAVRPVGPAGLAVTDAWTTVSTFAVEMTLLISGLRMSARSDSALPIVRRRSRGGGSVSTPSTRSMFGLAANRAARWPPRKRLTPVTRTTLGVMRLQARRALRLVDATDQIRNRRGPERRLDAGHEGFTGQSPERRPPFPWKCGAVSRSDIPCPRKHPGAATAGETRPPPASCERRPAAAERMRAYLPRFLRWTLVLRSSLRCFFFDMRLRRFLMTEPMRVP